MRNPLVLILFSFLLQGNLVLAEELLFNAVPYKIKLCLAPEFPISDKEKNDLSEILIRRSKNQVGELWNLNTEFSTSSAVFESQCLNPPPEWETFDKIFLAVLRQRPTELLIQEFDVKTRWTGRQQTYSIENIAKTADVLWKALTETFSPVAKLEKASPSSAMLRIQGSSIFIPQNVSPDFVTEIAQRRKILLPFICFKNKDGKTNGISPIPYTVLLAEEHESSSNLLHCTIKSSLPGSLITHRRGLSEILALAVPTPKVSTFIQLQSRRPNDADEKKGQTPKTLSICEVLEIKSKDSDLERIGQTSTDGSFLLEPLDAYQVRMIVLRSGRSVLAMFPVVRGLEDKILIPIPDDSVRLEAEAVLLGLQEEMIDTAARRKLLKQKLTGSQESENERQTRETRSELAKLKDADQFMVELDQLRLRFHSVDPIVQRRIDRLFNETQKAIPSVALY